MNKDKLLATPDTCLMTESVGATGGEDEVSGFVPHDKGTQGVDPSLEEDSHIWLQAQVLHLQSQNATLKLALEETLRKGRKREDSNPGRSDQTTVWGIREPQTEDVRLTRHLVRKKSALVK